MHSFPFSPTQGSLASKEAGAWGWPFYASPTQLHLQAGSCVSLSPNIAGKLQAIAATDELLQLCSATKITKGQWSHTWQAAWLHDISCVVRCASVCMRLTERERSCWELMPLNSGGRLLLESRFLVYSRDREKIVWLHSRFLQSSLISFPYFFMSYVAYPKQKTASIFSLIARGHWDGGWSSERWDEVTKLASGHREHIPSFFRANLRKMSRIDIKRDGTMKKYKTTGWEKEKTQRETGRKTKNKAQCSSSSIVWSYTWQISSLPLPWCHLTCLWPQLASCLAA